MAVSESLEEFEGVVLGGEGPSMETKRAIRSKGFLVRKTGLLVSTLLCASGSSFVFFGRLSEQFSQGLALFLSFSS